MVAQVRRAGGGRRKASRMCISGRIAQYKGEAALDSHAQSEESMAHRQPIFISSYAIDPETVTGIGSLDRFTFFAPIERDRELVRSTELEISNTAPRVPLGYTPSEHKSFEEVINAKDTTPQSRAENRADPPPVNVKIFDQNELGEIKKAHGKKADKSPFPSPKKRKAEETEKDSETVTAPPAKKIKKVKKTGFVIKD